MIREQDFELTPEDHSSTIDAVIERYPYYTTVRLISDASVDFTPKPCLREVTNTTNLMDLIRSKNTASESYIEAVPMDQVRLDPSFQNKLQFHGNPQNEAVIHIDQLSYQKLPNLNPPAETWHRTRRKRRSEPCVDSPQVRKITNDKIGSGGHNHSRYRYKIKIKLCHQALLESIIKTLFSNAQVESYIYDESINLPIPEVRKDTMHMPVNQVALSDLDDFKQKAEGLLMLYTDLDPQQVITNMDVDTIALTRYTMHNVCSKSITGAEWKLLSLHTKDTHTFIQRYQGSILVRDEIS
ncbi:hypothetical protein KGF57_000812 [Candida theae]|uniref:Uncharacterized protein n=1 Tax=Candida theae TaxID=1198502 RepID=A0AAD5BIJ8_9ASCO|nr:uncharacterized protein KGF57_000812 [Candida theae]KAI5965019.1 hypothetical protein KGF57_000812 [Candida theae]